MGNIITICNKYDGAKIKAKYDILINLDDYEQGDYERCEEFSQRLRKLKVYNMNAYDTLSSPHRILKGDILTITHSYTIYGIGDQLINTSYAIIDIDDKRLTHSYKGDLKESKVLYKGNDESFDNMFEIIEMKGLVFDGKLLIQIICLLFIIMCVIFIITTARHSKLAKLSATKLWARVLFFRYL
jgi:hypothetical protein